jgi:DNA-binding CsgD family transcriptional regulator
MTYSQRNPSVTLAQVTASPEYFARAANVIKRLQLADDRNHAVEILQQATLAMGAEVAYFASVANGANRLGADWLLLACDPRWCSEYAEHDWWADDPWLHHALNRTEPIRGCDVPLKDNGKEKAIVELAVQFGFASAVIVPVPARNRFAPSGVLCLGSSVHGYFEDDGYLAFKVIARSLAMELHEWWLARARDEFVQASGLNLWELALLGHELEGRSSKVIANHLRISRNAVDLRFRRINKKLGVAQRAIAARLVAGFGLI